MPAGRENQRVLRGSGCQFSERGRWEEVLEKSLAAKVRVRKSARPMEMAYAPGDHRREKVVVGDRLVGDVLEVPLGVGEPSEPAERCV